MRSKASSTDRIPLVSIIIPTRNSGRYLGSLLESIENQTYKSVQTIVVDNFSRDETEALCRSFRVTFVHLRGERSRARNYGAKMASGHFLFFVDSDMVLTPSLLEDCVTEARASGYDALIVPELAQGETLWGRIRQLEKQLYLNAGEMEYANRFVSRNAFWAVGGWDEGLLAGEDYDLHHKLKEGGFLLGRADSFIIHDEGLSLKEILGKKFHYAISVSAYLRKRPGFAIREFNPLKRLYLQKRHLLLSGPADALALILIRSIVTFVALLGFLYGFVCRTRLPGLGGGDGYADNARRGT